VLAHIVISGMNLITWLRTLFHFVIHALVIILDAIMLPANM
jgi:hypothetical protein